MVQVKEETSLGMWKSCEGYDGEMNGEKWYGPENGYLGWVKVQKMVSRESSSMCMGWSKVWRYQGIKT